MYFEPNYYLVFFISIHGGKDKEGRGKGNWQLAKGNWQKAKGKLKIQDLKVKQMAIVSPCSRIEQRMMQYSFGILWLITITQNLKRRTQQSLQTIHHKSYIRNPLDLA